MNNEIMEEKALQYALGTLRREEVASFEAALQEDRALQDTVQAYQRVNEAVAFDAPQVEPPFQAYAQIMGRLQDESEATQPSTTPERKLIPFLSWAGWAAAACAVFLLALNFSTSAGGGGANSPDIMLSQLGQPGSDSYVSIKSQDGLEERMIELAELAEAYWFTHEGLPPEGALAGSSSSASGFTIFDRRYKIGFIGVEYLPVDKQGAAYHVWAKIAGQDKPVRAGALQGGENSRGLFFFDLSQNETLGDVEGGLSFFVTEESEPSPVAPSSQVVLGES